MSLIIYAIPVFFLLIGIELLIARMRHLSYYRMNDAIANLSCGIGSQIAGVFTKTFTFIGYLFLYNHSIWKIPDHPITFILLFIGVDFFYYWFHRLAHEISFLWGSHVVHHQSEEYNLTVALRQAALQGVFSWVFYLPLAVVGFSPVSFLTIASLQTLYQFWIHTKLIEKMNPAFEYVFNTPSHHRVHHGVNPKYIDKNHGGTLIIFDRWFGTFQAEEEEVVYGVTKQTNSWNPLWVNFEYWIDLFKEALRVSNIRNFVLMMIKMPGWKPKELGGVAQLKEVTPQTFHKYDTEVSPGLSTYAFIQFVIILLATTGFLVSQDTSVFKDKYYMKVIAAALILFSLISIGGMFERKSWTPALEFFRLAGLGVFIYVLVPSTIAISLVIAFILISLVWFMQFMKEFQNNVQSHASSGL